MGTREWLLLVFLSVLWGGSFFFSAVAVKQVQPFTLAFLRMAIGALVLTIVAAASGLRLPKGPRIWLGLAFIGVVGTSIPFSLIYWGQTQIASGLASILNATTPIFTIIIAHFFTRDERFTPRRLAGVLAGLAGVAVIMGPSAIGGLAGSPLLAEAAILGAAFCYGTVSVFSKSLRAVEPIILSCGQLAFGAVAVLPAVLMFDAPFSRPAPDMTAIAAVLALALLSTALAFIIYFRILRSAGATNVMLVTLLVPVSAILLGSLVLGETLEPRHAAGLVLVALGLAVIDGRLLQYLRTLSARSQERRDASGLTSPPMLKDTKISEIRVCDVR
jgi:drug/metabolite transporter (DMT)-like permease